MNYMRSRASIWTPRRRSATQQVCSHHQSPPHSIAYRVMTMVPCAVCGFTHVVCVPGRPRGMWTLLYQHVLVCGMESGALGVRCASSRPIGQLLPLAPHLTLLHLLTPSSHSTPDSIAHVHLYFCIHKSGWRVRPGTYERNVVLLFLLTL